MMTDVMDIVPKSELENDREGVGKVENYMEVETKAELNNDEQGVEKVGNSMEVETKADLNNYEQGVERVGNSMKVEPKAELNNDEHGAIGVGNSMDIEPKIELYNDGQCGQRETRIKCGVHVNLPDEDNIGEQNEQAEGKMKDAMDVVTNTETNNEDQFEQSREIVVFNTTTIEPRTEYNNVGQFEQIQGKRTHVMFIDQIKDDKFLYCVECKKEHEGDCPVHGPLIVVQNMKVEENDPDRALHSLPTHLFVKESDIDRAGFGVFTNTEVQPGTTYGPYEGMYITDPEQANASGYCWQIYKEGTPSPFIDGKDTSSSNWMRYVNCALSESDQNLMALQYKGEIYYRCIKTILPKTELLVWYGDAFASKLGITKENCDLIAPNDKDMDINESGNTSKRIRLDLRKEKNDFPSNSGEKRKERNQKNQEKKRKSRGRLDFYFKDECKKIDLLNKIDKIKLFLGEGKFNTVSTFSVLHKLTDFFINTNFPGEENPQNDLYKDNFVPMYQYCSIEEAKSDNFFVACESSVQRIVSQVQAHDVNCSESLQLTNSHTIHGVLSADFQCSESHVMNWTSSPHMKNGKFLASAKLCHGYLSSGMLPNYFQKFCESSGIGDMGEVYINELTKSYRDIVENEANKSKEKALQDEIAMSAAVLSDEDELSGINILTDARHCWRKNAKFSDVVCLGGSTSKCLQVATISKDDDISSQRHELIGVKRIYEYLDLKDCPVNIHAHVNNSQVNKFIREERNPTENANFTWHVTKNIAKAAKKITSGSKSTNGIIWHEELSDKAASIKTHVFHSMKNCQHNAELLRANILSFIDHYQGNHEHCMATSRCRMDQNYECSKFIIKDEKAVLILTNFLKNLPVYRDAEKYKYCMDTHYVESFNNSLLQYVDKRICFGADNYKLRIHLAILDWNENINRPKTSDREVPYKRDPTCTFKIPVKKRKTFNFKEEIWNNWLDHFYN